MDIGDPIGNGAAVGSVLFVGSGPALAQANIDFFYHAATNTLKSNDQANTATSNFRIGTGDVTGNSANASGSVTINTGVGSPRDSGVGSAGNSGTVTVTTGIGGAVTSGASAGASGDLLLKTGTGGGNAQSGGSGGIAGHIILQPGSGGGRAAPVGAPASVAARSSARQRTAATFSPFRTAAEAQLISLSAAPATSVLARHRATTA